MIFELITLFVFIVIIVVSVCVYVFVIRKKQSDTEATLTNTNTKVDGNSKDIKSLQDVQPTLAKSADMKSADEALSKDMKTADEALSKDFNNKFNEFQTYATASFSNVNKSIDGVKSSQSALGSDVAYFALAVGDFANVMEEEVNSLSKSKLSASYSNNVNLLEQQYKTMTSDILTLSNATVSNTASINDLASKMTDANSKMGTMNSSLQSLKNVDIANLNNIANSLQGDVGSLKTNVDVIDKKYTSLESTVNTLKTSGTTNGTSGTPPVGVDMTAINSQFASVNTSMDSLTKDNANLKTNFAGFSNDVNFRFDKMNNSMMGFSNDLGDINSRLGVFGQNMTSLSNDVSSRFSALSTWQDGLNTWKNDVTTKSTNAYEMANESKSLLSAYQANVQIDPNTGVVGVKHMDVGVKLNVAGKLGFSSYDISSDAQQNVNINSQNAGKVVSFDNAGVISQYGQLKVMNDKCIELGGGVSGKDTNAGKMCYNNNTNTVDIYGAGTGNAKSVKIRDKLDVNAVKVESINIGDYVIKQDYVDASLALYDTRNNKIKNLA